MYLCNQHHGGRQKRQKKGRAEIRFFQYKGEREKNQKERLPQIPQSILRRTALLTEKLGQNHNHGDFHQFRRLERDGAQNKPSLRPG